MYEKRQYGEGEGKGGELPLFAQHCLWMTPCSEIGCHLHSKAINSNLMTFNNTVLPCYPAAMSCCAACTSQSSLIKSFGEVLAYLDH
jgi:hypothetical protein